MAELSPHQLAFFEASSRWESFVKDLRERNRFPESVDFVNEALAACLDRLSRLATTVTSAARTEAKQDGKVEER